MADNSAFRPRPRYHDPRLVAGAHAGIRASDADRDQLVEVLKTGFAEGRLSQDEYNVRMERAYTARTYGELGALAADLPRAAYPAYRPRRVNSLAVASMVCGLLGFFGFTAIAAVILGHKSLREIRQTGEPGTGMAKTGLVLGWAAITIFVILIALAVLGVVVATSRSGSAVPAGTHLLPVIRHVPGPPAG